MSLFLKNKINSQYQENKPNEMIYSKCFVFKNEQGKHNKNN